MPEEQETEDWFKRPLADLMDSDHWSTGERRPRVGKTISPVIIVGKDADGNAVAVNPFDDNGNLKVINSVFKTEPVTTTGAVATLTLTERLEIVGLHADANMAAIVADRDINIAVAVPVITSGVLLKVIETAAITLSNNENGAFFFPAGPSHWTNDNTTVARVADQNPFPMTFEIGSAFQVLNDNIQAGDEMGIELWFRFAGVD